MSFNFIKSGLKYSLRNIKRGKIYMNEYNVIETISKRKSDRTYLSSRPVEDGKLEILKEYMTSLKSNTVQVIWTGSSLPGIKLGTYGVITGATGYLVGIVKDQGKETTIDLGNMFERVILKATSLGLSTCWMAGSYNKKDFMKHLDLKNGEIVSIVSPLGYKAEKKKKRDKFLAFISKSYSRKPWDKIFFDEDWNTPLSIERSGKLKPILDMVQIAPSSGNKQPWRLLKKESTLYLYLHTPSSMTFRGLNTGYNDLGIVKSHIELTAEELNIKGVWKFNEPVELKKKDLEFICSWEVH